MFSVCYNLSLLIFAIFSLPGWLWQRLARGKYRSSLLSRLGITLPSFSPQEGQNVIWIHAVSMGETRAIVSLFRKIRQTFPHDAIVISTTTETGQQEAKRSMPDADAHFFLPLDFSWAIKRFMKKIRPTSLILSESDFWYHLMKIAKERGVKIALVNGKVSDRSSRRFQKFPFLTRRLFSLVDLFCLQSERYCQRFAAMGIPKEKLSVTGNLKLDSLVKTMEAEQVQLLRKTLQISKQDPILVIGSTHAPEEEWLLSALEPVWNKIPQLKVLLVPRHPERFESVAKLLKKKDIAFQRFSQQSDAQRLVLIDAMGLLNPCYQIATVAIVAGSYVSHIGGHNLYEPIQHHIPVFFGPHMHGQLDIKELIVTSQAGKEVTLEELPKTLIHILTTPSEYQSYKEACSRLIASVQGSTQRTFEHICGILKKEH